MLKSLKEAKKVKKPPFQATLGMLSMPKDAKVVRPCKKFGKISESSEENPYIWREPKKLNLSSQFHENASGN